MEKWVFVFLFYMLTGNLSILAQDSLSIGSWQSHLPYTQGYYLSQSPEKIIYSTQGSIFTIDKEDLSIEFLDKVNSLTDVGIEKHAYDEQGQQLVVIYDDSGIDILSGNEVMYIPDIKNNSSIIGDKRIYNIQVNNNRSAFLSCGFGVVEFNLDSYEFGFSCFTGIPVYQTTYFGKYICAATEDGLYYFDTEKNNNPADFQQWEHAGTGNQLPEIYLAKDIIEWNDHIYLCSEYELWKADELLSFELVYSVDQNDGEISFLNKNYGEVFMGVAYQWGKSKVLFFNGDDQLVQSNDECSVRIHYAELDESGRLWYADKFLMGSIRYALNRTYPCESITINSPYSAKVADIHSQGDQLFVASGDVDESYTYIYQKDGFFIWNGEKWKNYNEFIYPVFAEKKLYDCFRILPHPQEEKVYIGSYHNGLIILDQTDDSMLFYDQDNSTLAGKTGDPTRERISGMAFDETGNLWISNFGAPQPISVLTRDNEWFSFNVNSGKDLRDVVIDKNGYKWFIIDREVQGILVYDEGDDLADPSDDRQRIISKNNSSLQSNKVNAIEVDLDGDVWVGTAVGPVVFECGQDVFSSECRGNRRKTVLEGIPAYLLNDVSISCIEIDGANRKWFGSENGIFVQSASGEEEIHHFTRENSPLFDNSIADLSFNQESGTMYIATAKGILSYRTETSFGGEKHRGDVYAFPNPVRPDYRGPIALKGFARDSNVKITDIKGQLIHETKSLGGQAIWDGYDYSGRRAASGVYLVFATINDNFGNIESLVSKILVIKGE